MNHYSKITAKAFYTTKVILFQQILDFFRNFGELLFTKFSFKNFE